MKLKSFLFLAAVLAMGLAFASCDGDPKEVPGPTVNRGYASDADAIMAAFELVPEVWLTRETNLGGAILAIRDGKTLHVNGKKVNVNGNTVLVVEGTLDLNDTGSVINTTADIATLIGVTAPSTQEAQEAHYSNGNTAGTTGVLFHPGGGNGAVSGSKYIIAGDAEEVLKGGSLAATGTGTIGIVIGAVSNTNAAYDIRGGGSLVVTGNMSLGTGYVQTYGLLEVKGALSGGTLDSASEVIRGGSQVTALSAAITGGSISNALTVLNPSTFGAATGGTLVTFGEVLTADPTDVLVTFAGPAKFGAAPAATLKAKFNDDVEFEAAGITIADAEFGGNVTSATEQTTATAARFTGNSSTLTGYLTVTNLSGNVTVKSGSLSTAGNLTLGAGLSVILGANGGIAFTSGGKLTGTGYEVSGDGGSLLNTEASGTTVTLAANGIAKQTGAASVPSIVFGGAANLVYTADAEINGFNLDVENGGTITVEGASKTLTITGGGSITAKGDPAGTLAAGKLYIVTNSAGSLVAGTLYGETTIGAGSYGTFAEATNFIYSNVSLELAGTKAAYGLTNGGSDIETDTGAQAITDEVLAVFDDTPAP